jgi:hypothetical protein
MVPAVELAWLVGHAGLVMTVGCDSQAGISCGGGRLLAHGAV